MTPRKSRKVKAARAFLRMRWDGTGNVYMLLYIFFRRKAIKANAVHYLTKHTGRK